MSVYEAMHGSGILALRGGTENWEGRSASREPQNFAASSVCTRAPLSALSLPSLSKEPSFPFRRMNSSQAIPFPCTVSTGNSIVCIRPVTHEDRDRILEGLRAMSPETAYRRFFTPTFYPSEAELQYLTEVDGDTHMALGAVDCERDGTPGIGVARYVRLDTDPSIAEAAVVVIDAYQGRGIGSMLLSALSMYAGARGVETFRGYVLADNTAVLRYFRALGASSDHTETGIVQVDVPVYTHRSELPTGPETERMRRAWRHIEAPTPNECC